MSKHVQLANECGAPRCHVPVTDSQLCDGCVKILRDHLGQLAGSPAARRVRDDHPGPWRDANGILPTPDRGLLADVELTATRQDVTAPDTTRPAEIVEDGERRTKDRPELAPAVTTLPFHGGASAVLADARRDLCQLVCDVLDRRYGAFLDLEGRAVLRGERLYRAKTTKPRVPGQLGEAHGPWAAAIVPGRTPAEHAAWLWRHAWDVALLEYAGHAADDLARLVDRANSVIVRPERVCLGHCGRCYDRDDGTSAVIDVWADQGADTASCPRCGQEFDVVAYRRRMLDSAAEQWVSAPHAARALVDWVRDVRCRDAENNPTLEDPKPLTASAVAGMGERGRIAYRDPTSAEVDAARAADRQAPPPARMYRLGDVMAAVLAMHQEELARRRRSALRAGQRRTVSADEAGSRRAAG